MTNGYMGNKFGIRVYDDIVSEDTRNSIWELLMNNNDAWKWFQISDPKPPVSKFWKLFLGKQYLLPDSPLKSLYNSINSYLFMDMMLKTYYL